MGMISGRGNFSVITERENYMVIGPSERMVALHASVSALANQIYIFRSCLLPPSPLPFVPGDIGSFTDHLRYFY